MKYGITENHKFVLIDDDLKRLKNTLPFMPQLKEAQIVHYEESEVAKAIDGNWYEKEHVPQRPLEEARTEKLDELNGAFTKTSQTAHCTSSLGFEINADETANRNISSLIIAMEAGGNETVQFCAYDNRFHEVTLAQLKTMQLEIIANAQAIYQQKWALRERINSAETGEELDAIVIGFNLGEE